MVKQILLIILVVLSLVLGGSVGILYQAQKDSTLIQKSMTPDTLTSLLSSPIVTLIAASGKVSQIKENEITISSGNESLIATFAKASSLYLEKKDSKDGREKVGLQELKIGDNVSVNMKLLPNGNFEAYFIFIQAR